MSMNRIARAYLHAFFNGQEFEGGLSHREALAACSPDFTLDSLSRLDAFLDDIRAQKPPPEPKFIEDQANQNLLYLLAFYVGETIRRVTDATANWYRYEEMVAMDSGWAVFGPGFYSSTMCLFNKTGPKASANFVPLNAIVTRMLENDSKSIRLSAEWAIDSIGSYPPLPPFDAGTFYANLTKEERVYAGIPEPAWMENDFLKTTFRRHPYLWEGGRLVWGRIVQANTALMREGAEDHGGEVLYDPTGKLDQRALIEPARRLQALKGTKPTDKQEREFAEYLTEEWIRAVAKRVPPSISPHGLLCSTMLFHRGHLPNGRLCLSYFPVLINDKHPGALMLMPSKWWREELVGRWTFEEDS